MTIRDILIRALRRIGREDLSADVGSGVEPSGEGAEVVTTMLYCINATEDELARYYFPLKCTETLHLGQSKTLRFSDFSNTPVKILSVKSDGAEIAFELQPNCLIADATSIEVTYYYAPKQKGVDDESTFGETGGGKIIELGAAAEYCLIGGEAALAEMWETRYREAIDMTRQMLENDNAYSGEKLDRGGYIPPRRWV